MCGRTHDVVIYSKFHRKPFRGFGAIGGGRNFAVPITLWLLFLNNLYYRSIREWRTVTMSLSCTVSEILSIISPKIKEVMWPCSGHALVVVNINLHTKFEMTFLAVPKIWWGPTIYKGHVILTTPICGQVVIVRLTLDIVYLCIKSDVYSYSRSGDMNGVLKVTNGSRDHDHAPLRDGLRTRFEVPCLHLLRRQERRR